MFHFDRDLLGNKFYKGGGGGSSSAVAAAPVPQAIRPVTERLADFSTVERDTKKRLAKRKGLKSTILAGETGQIQGGSVSSNFGAKTLLGG
jgi:hypothetical protein